MTTFNVGDHVRVTSDVYANNLSSTLVPVGATGVVTELSEFSSYVRVRLDANGYAPLFQPDEIELVLVVPVPEPIATLRAQAAAKRDEAQQAQTEADEASANWDAASNRAITLLREVAALEAAAAILEATK